MLNTTHYQRNANQNYNEVPSCTSQNAAAAAAAKSLQSCPILCDPINSSPPGSSVPEILQARILQWVAISFSMLVRMAAIKKSTNSKCWRGCGEKGTLLLCWWKCKLVQPLWRTVWRFLKKTGNRTAIRPSNPTAGHTHQGNQN